MADDYRFPGWLLELALECSGSTSLACYVFDSIFDSLR
jgi:hypothetical protein